MKRSIVCASVRLRDSKRRSPWSPIHSTHIALATSPHQRNGLRAATHRIFGIPPTPLRYQRASDERRCGSKASCSRFGRLPEGQAATHHARRRRGKPPHYPAPRACAGQRLDCLHRAHIVATGGAGGEAERHRARRDSTQQQARRRRGAAQLDAARRGAEGKVRAADEGRHTVIRTSV